MLGHDDGLRRAFALHVPGWATEARAVHVAWRGARGLLAGAVHVPWCGATTNRDRADARAPFDEQLRWVSEAVGFDLRTRG